MDDAFKQAGLSDAEIGMKGTSTTFYSENPSKRLGHHWDADPANLGDYDINITSPTMTAKLDELGIAPSEKYGVFKTKHIESSFKPLDDFQKKWAGELGRDVNFVGYPKPVARDATEYILRARGVTNSSTIVTSLNRADFEQQLIARLGQDIKANPLRQEYEAKVAELARYQHGLTDNSIREKAIANMANLPGSERALAEAANNARRQLGVEYKNLTPEPLRDYIYEVNLKRYGDPLGPDVDLLVQRGKTYAQIVESAARPNPDVNKLLDGFGKWLSKQPDDYVHKYMR